MSRTEVAAALRQPQGPAAVQFKELTQALAAV
jgi:hypothetical protein